MTHVRSWLSRFLAPALGRCYRCKTSLWGPIRNEPHLTWWDGRGRACFPLCERCWSELTPTTRMPFYGELVDSWIAGFPENRVEYDRNGELIRQAVMRGG